MSGQSGFLRYSQHNTSSFRQQQSSYASTCQWRAPSAFVYSRLEWLWHLPMPPPVSGPLSSWIFEISAISFGLPWMLRARHRLRTNLFPQLLAISARSPFLLDVGSLVPYPRITARSRIRVLDRVTPKVFTSTAIPPPLVCGCLI